MIEVSPIVVGSVVQPLPIKVASSIVCSTESVAGLLAILHSNFHFSDLRRKWRAQCQFLVVINRRIDTGHSTGETTHMNSWQINMCGTNHGTSLVVFAPRLTSDIDRRFMTENFVGSKNWVNQRKLVGSGDLQVRKWAAYKFLC